MDHPAEQTYEPAAPAPWLLTRNSLSQLGAMSTGSITTGWRGFGEMFVSKPRALLLSG